MQLFIPASHKKEAERDAPPWACRFAKVQGGFMVFDSEDALWVWKDSVRSKPRATATATAAPECLAKPRRADRQRQPPRQERR